MSDAKAPRILLATEIGAGSGHAVRLAKIAARIGDMRQSEFVVALRNLAEASVFPRASMSFVQAPVWPFYMVGSGRNRPGRTVSFADLLGDVGFGNPLLLRPMLDAWRALADLVRPDLVIADYAPAAMLALRGRCPVIAVGTGFSVPPSGGDAFPPLSRDAAAGSPAEPAILDGVNRVLGEMGETPLPSLPALFAGIATFPASLSVFDPYRRAAGELVPPAITGLSAGAERGGEEVFVYLWENAQFDEVRMAALATLKLPRRVYIPRLEPVMADFLTAQGCIVEARPVAVADIVRRSRVAVHSGGHGLASELAVAGIPQFILHRDFEKKLIAAALEAAGAARGMPFRQALVPAIHEALHELHAGVAYRDAARNLAASLATEASRPTESDRVAGCALDLLTPR